MHGAYVGVEEATNLPSRAREGVCGWCYSGTPCFTILKQTKKGKKNEKRQVRGGCYLLLQSSAAGATGGSLAGATCKTGRDSLVSHVRLPTGRVAAFDPACSAVQHLGSCQIRKSTLTHECEWSTPISPHLPIQLTTLQIGGVSDPYLHSTSVCCVAKNGRFKSRVFVVR